MRARQFLSLAQPLIVAVDGSPVVALAFVISGGPFGGRLGMMTVPFTGGEAVFSLIEDIGFPPPIRESSTNHVRAELDQSPKAVKAAGRLQ